MLALPTTEQIETEAKSALLPVPARLLPAVRAASQARADAVHRRHTADPADPVTPARRSPAANRRASSARTADDLPAHSLTDLIAELGTVCRNQCASAQASTPSHASPTPTSSRPRRSRYSTSTSTRSGLQNEPPPPPTTAAPAHPTPAARSTTETAQQSHASSTTTAFYITPTLSFTGIKSGALSLDRVNDQRRRVTRRRARALRTGSRTSIAREFKAPLDTVRQRLRPNLNRPVRDCPNWRQRR